MKRIALIASALLLPSFSACVDTNDEIVTSSLEQGVSSTLLDQGFGFGGQATGGAGAERVYVVNSTADDGSCGTLR